MPVRNALGIDLASRTSATAVRRSQTVAGKPDPTGSQNSLAQAGELPAAGCGAKRRTVSGIVEHGHRVGAHSHGMAFGKDAHALSSPVADRNPA
jgi:hypothetical protein